MFGYLSCSESSFKAIKHLGNFFCWGLPFTGSCCKNSLKLCAVWALNVTLKTDFPLCPICFIQRWPSQPRLFRPEGSMSMLSLYTSPSLPNISFGLSNASSSISVSICLIMWGFPLSRQVPKLAIILCLTFLCDRRALTCGPWWFYWP